MAVAVGIEEGGTGLGVDGGDVGEGGGIGEAVGVGVDVFGISVTAGRRTMVGEDEAVAPLKVAPQPLSRISMIIR